MKKSDKILKTADTQITKLQAIVRHIRNVQDNCLLLGERLIRNGEFDLGRRLIANSLKHDASKFEGVEWEHMSPGTPTEAEEGKLKLKMAINHHNQSNTHHPEYWGKIHQMPRIYVAEMVCDWKARSEEFGTSLKDYIQDSATKRWDFTKEDKVYKEIMEFVDMLCEKPFTNLS